MVNLAGLDGASSILLITFARMHSTARLEQGALPAIEHWLGRII